MRVAFVSSGLEHLGIEALSAFVKANGHEAVTIYEPRAFSSGTGTDSPLLARLLDPTPDETAERIVAAQPDVVAFTSYTVTHRWAVEVARAVKGLRKVPIVFGGPHVGSLPERAISEWSIDAVVEGEGEGALLDLIACVEGDRFGRTDVPNCTFKGRLTPIRNAPRPLIHDLDALPFADKSGFYGEVPGLESEYYVIARRGCPYRCSFCEYSRFPTQYPGERKSVRRRSVENVIAELRPWKARGRIRKVFFWDPIFTLDVHWMEEFAEAWSREIGLPFECYTHPSTMSRDMARLLAKAGCIMVRVGVQTVNSETLSAVDRRGDRERVQRTLEQLAEFGVPYSVDHIIDLPGEGAQDQLAALRFYNEVRPSRIVAHWMTYFPGTAAFDTASADGTLTPEQVNAALDGDIGGGYMFDGNRPSAERRDLERLSAMFDLLPLLPASAVHWMLESGSWRRLRGRNALRQLGVLALALRGEPATREHVRHIVAATSGAVVKGVERKLRRALTP